MEVTVGAPLNVRPGDPGAVSDVTPARFVPVTVTTTELPGRPVLGLIPLRVGVATEKFSEFEAGPLAPVMLMVCVPVAFRAMFRF